MTETPLILSQETIVTLEKSAPKKRGRKPNPNSVKKDSYFEEREEQAVKDYLFSNLSTIEKNELFKTIINPCLLKLVDGIMTMPKFQKILGISREQLKEDAYFHLIFQMGKYNPEKIGKSGEKAKAYSYYGTVVKNYILQIKITNDSSVANHGGVLDVDTLEGHIPDNRRGPNDFEEIRAVLIEQLEKAIDDKHLNKNDLIVGNTLKYMVANWHKLEFRSKNEFIRLLCHYTQLNPPVVARSLKKYKLLTYETETNNTPTKIKKQPELISTLDSIITEAFNMTDLNEAKRKVCNYLEKSRINEVDKQTMIMEIKLKNVLSDFHKYIANALLAYENLRTPK